MNAESQLKLVLEVEPAAGDDDFDEPGALARPSLVNEGDGEVIVNGRLAVSQVDGPGELSFHVSGPDGRALGFAARVNVGKPLAEDFTTLPPSGAVSAEIDLRNYFRFEGSGRYCVQATYKNRWPGPDVDVRVWTGTLRSEPIEVDVGAAPTPGG